jgi:hypothetical protein
MRNFIFGMMVGILLTAIGVQAADKERQRGTPQPPRIDDARERQFQLELEHMRKQTELEQARMQGRKQPC